MKKLSTFFTISILATTGFAQLGTPLTQYSGNQIVFNPGYAGIYDLLSINASFHQSWIKIPGAPRMLNFNGHAPFKNNKHAWGWVFQREQWGALSGNLVYGNYGYKVFLKHGVLSLGLQAGVLNHVTNWNEIDSRLVEDPTDPGYAPSYGVNRTATTKFDANIGAYYLSQKFYIGLSAIHLTNLKYDETTIYYDNSSSEDYYSQLPTQFFLTGGYHHEISDKWSIRPELLMRYVYTTPLSVNLGAHAYYRDSYSFGINFMTGQKAVSFCAKAVLLEWLRVGYSYNIFYGPIKPYQRGSHEISINYQLQQLWKAEESVDLLWL